MLPDRGLKLDYSRAHPTLNYTVRAVKTIQYVNSFSPLSQTFIYDHVVGLERRGVDAHVATHSRQNERQRPFRKVETVSWPGRWNPRRILYRILAEVRGDAPKIANWPIWRDQLEVIARRVDADLIHAHFGPQGVKAAPVAHRIGIPLVVTFYGYDISQLPHSDLWREQYGEVWATADSIHVLSEEMKKRAIDLGAKASKLRVIHLSRELGDYEYAPPKRPVRKLLSVGRLVEKKGHADTIRAVRHALDRGVDVTLDILGGGRLQEDLRELIRSIGVEDRVTLHGEVESEDVLAHMNEADAFILCSKTTESGDKEGTPTVFIEAQSVGLPCIATYHAGIPEMIPEPSHQFLAPEGNVNAIASCIVQMTSCSVGELRRIANLGREKVEQDFDRDRELKKTIDAYRSVMDSRK